MTFTRVGNALSKGVERLRVMVPELPSPRRCPSVRSSPRHCHQYLHHSILPLYRISSDTRRANSRTTPHSQRIHSITPHGRNSGNDAAVSKIHNRRHHTSRIPLMLITSRRVSLISRGATFPSPRHPKVPPACPLGIRRVRIPVIQGPTLVRARLALLDYRWARHRAPMMGDADTRHRRRTRHIDAY
jgi:hypothetical protein